MSSPNGTAVAAVPPPLPTQVTNAIIEAFTNEIAPGVNFLMISTVWTAVLAPLVLALFYFSNRQSRQRPVFILNLCALGLGLIGGAINIHSGTQGLLHPFKVIAPAETMAANVILLWTPWFSEAILIIRLLAVYKPRTVLNKVALLAPTVVMKIVRSTMFIIFLVRLQLTTDGTPAAMQALIGSWLPKVTYIAELADNLYMSGMFLWGLYTRGHPFNRKAVGGGSDNSRFSFSSKVRSLFWIAATSFVFPVVLGICNITLIFATGNIVVTNYIGITNLYLVLISTVFATLWSQTLELKDTKATILPSTRINFTRSEPVQITVASAETVTITPFPSEKSWRPSRSDSLSSV